MGLIGLGGLLTETGMSYYIAPCRPILRGIAPIVKRTRRLQPDGGLHMKSVNRMRGKNRKYRDVQQHRVYKSGARVRFLTYGELHQWWSKLQIAIRKAQAR